MSEPPLYEYVCPKCGLAFTDDLEWDDAARAHASETREERARCIYAACDDPACRALLVPQDEEDFLRALTHWKDHRLHGGCSHGC